MLSLINFHDFDYFVQVAKTTDISHTIWRTLIPSVYGRYLQSIILGRRKVLKNLESIHHERALRSVRVDAYFVNLDHHQIILVQLQVA